MRWIGSLLRSLKQPIAIGKHSQAEWASAERVEAHSALRDDFVQRVLQMEWAFISDESSLWDFHEERNSTALQERIKTIYGVDVFDIESGRIADIFDRIASAHASRIVSG